MPLNLFDISERYELRHKANRPEFNLSEWAQFPSRFEARFNDHFGLRGHLVAAGNWLTLSLFPGDSPDKRVLIGQQDWLYFSGQPALSSMQDYRGGGHLLLPNWKPSACRCLGRQAWLAERGIPHLLVIAPNKGKPVSGIPANPLPIDNRAEPAGSTGRMVATQPGAKLDRPAAAPAASQSRQRPAAVLSH